MEDVLPGILDVYNFDLRIINQQYSPHSLGRFLKKKKK